MADGGGGKYCSRAVVYLSTFLIPGTATKGNNIK